MIAKKISKIFLSLFLICFVFYGEIHAEQIYMPLLTVFQNKPESEGSKAMRSDIEFFINSELPVITTIPPLYQYKNEDVFQKLKIEAKWLVYINKDNTFVLLLPKSFKQKIINEKNILSKLGFNNNYLTLIKSSEFDNIFSNDSYKNISIDISHFDKLFIKEKSPKESSFETYLHERILDINPIPAKMIIASGHGSEGGSQVVGIRPEQYHKYLKILNEINTKFVAITSCYTGGENLLKMHKLLSTSLEKFIEELNYPIVIQATTAEVSFAFGENESNLIEFFTQIEAISKNKQFYFGIPFYQLEGIKRKRNIISIKEALKSFYSLSPFQLHLPSIRMPGTNTFFRVADVDNLLILTYVSLQQFKIAEKIKIALEEKKKLEIESSEEGTAKIDEKEWIQKVKNLPPPVLHIPSDIKRVIVYPSVIRNITIEMDETIPFTSHIRGDGQHFIEKIKAPNLNFVNILENIFFVPLFKEPDEWFYGKNIVTWFVEELECRYSNKNNKITGLIIQKGSAGKASIVTFKQNEKYQTKYLNLDKGESLYSFKEVSKEEYAQLVRIVYMLNKTTPAALREASGGNENEITVRKAYENFTKKMEIDEVPIDNQNIKNIVSIIIENNQKFADKIIKLATDERTEQNTFIKSLELALLINLANKNQGFPEAINAAKKAINSSDISIQSLALDLFKNLVNKNQGFPEAINSAEKAINSSDISIQSLALDLFKNLVNKNQGFPEAIAAAEKGSNNPNYSIQNQALELWKTLFEKNQGFPEAIAAVNRNIDNQDSPITAAILSLCKVLLEHNQGFPEAIAAAEKGSNNPNYSIRNQASELWKTLFEKNQGFPEAIAAAEKGINNPNYSIRNQASELWKTLFEKNQGFPEAIAAVNRNIDNQDNPIATAILSLCKVLLEHNQGFPEAIAAAEKGIIRQYPDIQNQALELWKTLFEKNQGFTEAIATINKYESEKIKRQEELINQRSNVISRRGRGRGGRIGSEGRILIEPITRKLSESFNSPEVKVSLMLDNLKLNLWKALFNKDQGFAAAISSAKEGMSSESIDTQVNALYLWKALVEANQSFENAINAATKGINSNNEIIKYAALDLWRELFNKKQGFEKAKEINNFELKNMSSEYIKK